MKPNQSPVSATVLAAGPDAIRIAIGERVEDPHPLADSLTLADLAFAAGSKVRAPRPDEPRAAVMGRGINSADFGSVLSQGFQGRVLAAYSGQTTDVRAICSPVEVQDLKPVDLPAIDADLALDPITELIGGEVSQHLAFSTAGGLAAKLTTYAKTVLVSREAVINDSVGTLAEIFGAIGASAGRIESRLVASLLENPPALSDGQPVFGAEFGNLIEGELLTGPALMKAMAALRSQMTSAGLKSDLRARFLVVDPFNEYMASHLVREAGLGIDVIVLSDIPSNHWYLLADPVVCPTVGALRLRGSASPLRVEQKPARNGQDGTQVRVSADFGHALLRRVGIVRVTY